MPKKTLNIEESEVADALRMLSKGDKATPPASAPSKPVKVKQTGPSSIVDLKDGTSMDLTALIQASIESYMAQKMAVEQQDKEVKSGPSGNKRHLDTSNSHKREASSKRPRPCFEQTSDEEGQSYEEDSQDEYEYEDESDSDENEDEREDTFTFSSVFGSGVNPDPNTVKGDSRGVARLEVHKVAPAHLSTPDGERPVTESASSTHTQSLGDSQDKESGETIDKDLYVPSKCSPNWSPSKGVVIWASRTFDEEWNLDQVKEYESKFVAPPELKHFFTPIPINKAIEEQLNSEYTKNTDKGFNRRDTERILFRAAKDICVAYGPIFQVLTMLGNRGDCRSERSLLSEGVLGIASAMIKITRARRELFRRYFDYKVSKDLYAFDPSHSQFFGGSSLDDRVKEAKTLSDTRQNMLFRPKPKISKKNYSATGFQENFRRQKSQKGQNGQNRGRGRGRGRGRRYNKNGKGQSEASKTSDSK